MTLSTTSYGAGKKTTTLYHIIHHDAWMRAVEAKSYRPESLKKEGFIHLSTREQVVGTANAFFRGQRGLELLEIELSQDDSNLKWEKATDRKDLFPHYFAPLPTSAVKRLTPLEPDADGTFSFPKFK